MKKLTTQYLQDGEIRDINTFNIPDGKNVKLFYDNLAMKDYKEFYEDEEDKISFEEYKDGYEVYFKTNKLGDVFALTMLK